MFHHTTTVPPVAPELAGVPGVRVVHAAFADLDAIMDVEQRAYPIPWTRLNFADILAHPAQYAIQLLWDERLPDAPPSLIGYFVVMQGVQEAHLLNIAVHPDYQGQGWSVFLLRQLCYWALWHQARQVWLWRLLFVVGMIAGTWIWFTATGRTVNPRADMHPVLLVVAGLLVGYGTSLGNGCTSGHGVCGLGRLSLRSLAATGVFMATGIATVFVVRHVIGG